MVQVEQKYFRRRYGGFYDRRDGNAVRNGLTNAGTEHSAAMKPSNGRMTSSKKSSCPFLAGMRYPAATLLARVS
jgi:hypothetical protein